jgi:antitoxin CcdA
MRIGLRMVQGMSRTYDQLAPRKPTNLSVNEDLLARARAHNINLSATLEQALVEALRRKEREAWLAENQAAIERYNERIAEHGAFSDTLRSF